MADDTSSNVPSVEPSMSMTANCISPVYSSAGTISTTASASSAGGPQRVMWPPGSPRSSKAKPFPARRETRAICSPTLIGSVGRLRRARVAISCHRWRARARVRNADMPSMCPAMVAERPRADFPRAASERKSSTRVSSSTVATRTKRNTSRSWHSAVTSIRLEAAWSSLGGIERICDAAEAGYWPWSTLNN